MHDMNADVLGCQGRKLHGLDCTGAILCPLLTECIHHIRMQTRRTSLAVLPSHTHLTSNAFFCAHVSKALLLVALV